jgi:hypothetical protein
MLGEMPSTFAPRCPDGEPSPSRGSRRRFLRLLGTGTVAATAGCLSGLPGTGPETLSTEQFADSDRRAAWRYPAQDGDDAGIGYVDVTHGGEMALGNDRSAESFVFNSTVSDSSTTEAYNDYVPDWFRGRFRPPRSYRSEHSPVRMLAEPPGAWEGFHTYYDHSRGVREFAVELRDVGTEGTIEVPLVLDPGTDPPPERLHCSFTVQATEKGWLGRTVRASDSGTLAFGSEG